MASQARGHSFEKKEYIFAAEKLVNHSLKQDIVRKFVEKGFDEKKATEFVEKLDKDIRSISDKLNDGKPKPSIISELIDNGWEKAHADAVVHAVEGKENLQHDFKAPMPKKRVDAKIHFMLGVIIFLVVLILLFVTFEAFAGGILFYGAIIAGLLIIIYGIYLYIFEKN